MLGLEVWMDNLGRVFASLAMRRLRRCARRVPGKWRPLRRKAVGKYAPPAPPLPYRIPYAKCSGKPGNNHGWSFRNARLGVTKGPKWHLRQWMERSCRLAAGSTL